MTTLHEAAQKALELCERIRDAREVWSMGELRSVCLNLRSALAQQGPVGDAEKAKNLLSLTVGCLMRYEEGKHNPPYKAGSATANMVNDVVEYLQDWPKTAPAPQAQQEPDT